MIEDRFGFLYDKTSFSFGPVEIMPLTDLDERRAHLWNRVHPDGFFYPPEVRQVDRRSGGVRIGERPPLLHPTVPSHTLRLDLEIGDNHRKQVGGFIMHLLAYLFDTRLQFEHWWLDMRIPLNPSRILNFTRRVAEGFMSRCMRTWMSWRLEQQRLAVNLLYMHSRAPSYEWDWEQFTFEYMALDACWRLALKAHDGIKKPKRGDHPGRIRKMCSHFGIPIDRKLVIRIVNFRNDLFHEVLWDGSQPCLEGSADGLLLVGYLRRLNKRLIAAVLDADVSFISTRWWDLGGRYLLDRKR